MSMTPGSHPTCSLFFLSPCLDCGDTHGLQQSRRGCRASAWTAGTLRRCSAGTPRRQRERVQSWRSQLRLDRPFLTCPLPLLTGDQDRLPCASPPITQGDCEEQGCCYNPSDRVKPCYYGNTVTVQCTPDGQFSLAVSRAVTLPPLILDTVRLASGRGAGCVPVGQNNAFVLFRFPLSACGTTFQMAGDQGVYENELVVDRDVRTWSLGSITRDSTFRLHVRCSYSISRNFLPLSVQVFTLPPPPAVSQPGPLMLELRIATEQNYGSYYVRILTNPQQQPQCPYAGDNYRTQLVPLEAASWLQFPSHHQRFIVSTFTFMESASQRALTWPVYLHCSASVCLPSRLESCTISCPAGASKYPSSAL
uniref:Zona pellucida sperm-binding protein 4 n=1 Tax=Chelonoidis abingdonii TaxID=106734 RepID=A0A8C0GGM5_CHEAB